MNLDEKYGLYNLTNPFVSLFNKTLACFNGLKHKVLTYVEYRAVSSVFKILTPHPHSTQQVCPPSIPKAGGIHSPGDGGWGVTILEDARHRIGLLQSNLSAVSSIIKNRL